MSSSHISETQETIECLAKSFSSMNKNERSEAEKRLTELQKNLPNHINLIFSALKHESMVKAEIKLSCIVYIKNILRGRLELKLISKDLISDILKNLIDLILSTTLSDLCLKNVGPLIKDIFNYSEIYKDYKIIDEIVNVLVHFSRNMKEIKLIRALYIILENMIESRSVNEKNCADIFKKMLESSHLNLNTILENLKLIVPKENVELFLTLTENCRIIFYFLSLVIVKTRKDFKNFNLFLDYFCVNILPLSINLITSTIPEISPNYFICWTGQKDFDSKVNMMKAQCYQFVNAMIPYFGSIIHHDNFIKLASNLVDSSIINLEFVLNEKYYYLSNMRSESKEFPDNKYELIINRILVFLSRFLCKEPIISFFSKYAPKFLINNVIPLIVCTNVELKQMKDEGEDYTNFIDDCYNDRKSKKLKVIACDILVKMVKKYDGLNNLIISYALQLIDFCLKEESLQNINNYSLLCNDYCSRMNTIPAEFKIETAIMILCVLSESIYKNEKNMLNLKCLIELHFHKLFILNQDIIKCRLCIFIGLFVDDLFNPEDEKFSFCLEYLIFNVFSFPQNEGLAYQAVDIINEIITKKEFVKPFQNVIISSFGKLIQNIQTINISLFFDILYDIVVNYDVEHFVLELFDKLTSRIKKEVNNVTRIVVKNHNKKESTLVINKCFNVIKALSEKEKYVIKYRNEMENCIEPLICHMKSSKLLPLEEDLIAIATNFIKCSKSMTPTAEKIFPYLEDYIKKIDSLLFDLFELLNCYIIYGKQLILGTQENINKVIFIKMINIFRLASLEEGSYDKSPLLGSLLMQIWLQFEPNIPIHSVKEILLFTIEQIKQIDLKLINIPVEFFKFSSLVCVLYSGFIHYPLLTAECLVINNDVPNFLILTEAILSSRFYCAHQSKIIIIGISALISTNELLNNFGNFYMQFLNIMLTLLLQQKIEESKSLKVSLKKEIDCNFIDSGEEDNSDDDEDSTFNQSKKSNIKESVDQILHSSKESEEKEVNEIHDKVIGPSRYFDEYEIFRKCFEKIKSNSSDLVDAWVNKLNSREKEHLQNILLIKRISITNNNSENSVITIPRKVLKIKREITNTPNTQFNFSQTKDLNLNN